MPRNFTTLLPGLALSCAVAAAAWLLSELLKPHLLLEPLVIGIVLGIAASATLGNRPALKPGISFSSRTLLEFAIILLGFKLSFAKLAALGGPALLGVVLFVPLIVLAAIPLGRMFGLPPRLAVLIGVGSGICGSSAIAAVAPVIGADDEDAALAVSGLSVLGAGAVLLAAACTHAVALSDTQWGVWAGLSMQAVPNALAAAFARSVAAGDVGTIVKMARVALLAPIALGLAWWFRPSQGRATGPARGTAMGPSPSEGGDAAPKSRAPQGPGIPLYVVLFILAGALNSTGWLPGLVSSRCAQVSTVLMVVAMSALGLQVDVASLRQRAGPAFVMSSLLFLLVAASAYAWSAWVVAR